MLPSNSTSVNPYAACAIEKDPDLPAWIQNGGFLIVIIGLIQCFWGLARVCDHYFCQSMKVLCENYQISENLAGATFMAIGSSAGDLFISVFALFIQKSTVGMGTIIGSEIFNHLVISAACVLNDEKKQIKLDKAVLTRECLAYAASLFVLMGVLHGGKFKRNDFDHCLTVQWYHGLILVLFYCVYAGIAVKFEAICEFFGYKPEEKPVLEKASAHLEELKKEADVLDPEINHSVVGMELAPIDKSKPVSPSMASTDGLLNSSSARSNNAERSKSVDSKNIIVTIPEIKRELKKLHSGHTHDRAERIANKTPWAKFVHYFTLPLKTMFEYTIPDLHQEKNRKWFPLVAIVSCVWMGALAEVLLLCIDVLGDLIGVSAFVMGVSLSAIGASMPTLWSSIVVARDGFGDMAISNALGANIFSVLVGLGLPWLAYPLYIKRGYDGIEDGGIIPLLFSLVIILILYYTMIAFNSWTISGWMGWLFLVLYIVIITMCCTIFNTEFK